MVDRERRLPPETTVDSSNERTTVDKLNTSVAERQFRTRNVEGGERVSKKGIGQPRHRTLCHPPAQSTNQTFRLTAFFGRRFYLGSLANRGINACANHLPNLPSHGAPLSNSFSCSILAE
ncbi:hypothetical protein LR48_Vigan10g116100 [Vigna angularis]|uniref:Uncharacterized protein n=1 Tax=Phaseolus angularis TaxID=3914 RepID=A0A0L9VKL1_PHAAN|nr:hypothetical protein LR48_Vigan10g116100 [Vigna angularis]